MTLSNDQIERYARHLILDQVDEEGQDKISNAKVLVVGAGGIGSPALLYLVAAGVGEIHIVDDDTIDLSNLQRQILFRTKDVAKLKAKTAVKVLEKINPEPKLIAHPVRVDATNAKPLVEHMTLVLDGSDTYETRRLVAGFCTELEVPLVSSSATQFDGQLAVFRPWLDGRPCYECLFPSAPRSRMSCSEVGVFGPLVGIMGTMAANEALKLILDLNVDDRRLLIVDGLNLEFSPIKTAKNLSCNWCSTTTIA